MYALSRTNPVNIPHSARGVGILEVEERGIELERSSIHMVEDTWSARTSRQAINTISNNEKWMRKSKNIPPSIGDILGCGLARIKIQHTVLIGDCRLWKLLIAHSAYLIWVLRCERVIGNDGSAISNAEVRNRWCKMINDLLRMDCCMTNKRYESKALPKGLILQTWRGILKDEGNLPKDWTNTNGVLVGTTEKERDDG
ncbi:hypothetical protein F5879DRAFT_1064900 [Lentinula edodes]|nr:hypothetical protein F5879DRAFT_1064900 [Lentinula edodes]